MIQISVVNEVDKMRRHFEAIREGLTEKATAAALNRVGTMARTGGIRQIGKVYTLKRGTIAAQISLARASPRMAAIEVAITARGKRAIPLIEFAGRQTGAGVSFKIRRQGGRKTLKSSFVATMKSGHRGAFERKGKARLPIRELYTIGLPQMFIAREVVRVMSEIVKTRFPERLRHELAWRAARAAK